MKKNFKKSNLILDILLILCSVSAICLFAPEIIGLLLSLNLFGIGLIVVSCIGLTISLGLLTKSISIETVCDVVEEYNSDKMINQMCISKDEDNSKDNVLVITSGKYDNLFDNNYNDGDYIEELRCKSNSRYTRKRYKGKYLK